MGIIYSILILSFITLLLIHVIFGIVNLFFWVNNGIETVLHGRSFIDVVYYSIYLKWIILADGIWISFLLIFIIKRKYYKTDPELHYLNHYPIDNRKICVVIPTFNEEQVVERVVKDYKNQKDVMDVIVIDNHSTDSTVDIAKKCGARVITKDSNRGFAHSVVLGMREFMKTNANILAFTECDGTFSGYDLEKMIPYLDNCDLVIGTRQVQVLTQKGNQNSMFYVWGNYLLAKLIQIRYFSLLHLGIVQLTDVGCMHRCIRRDALEKIIDRFTHPDSDEVVISKTSGLIAILMTMIGIENNLRIVEVPVTFKKRIGISKTESDKKLRAVRYGLEFFWFIIAS